MPTAPLAKGASPVRLEFHITYTCPARCVFCSEEFRMNAFRRHPVSFEEACAVLDRLAQDGVDYVNFTGGEPTVFPRFPELLAYARARGFRIYMATMGALTAREAFAEKVIPQIDELSFSVHGHTPAIHDAMTETPCSFEALVATMKHAVAVRARLGRPHLFMNCVVNRHNIESVIPLMRLAAQLRVDQFLLSNPSSEGTARTRYRELAVPLAEWRQRGPEWLALARKLNIPLRFFALPFCVLGDAIHLANDHYFDPRLTVERIFLPDGSPALTKVVSEFPNRGRRFSPKCEPCVHRDACGGPLARYLDEFGDGELLPVRASGSPLASVAGETLVPPLEKSTFVSPVAAGSNPSG